MNLRTYAKTAKTMYDKSSREGQAGNRDKTNSRSLSSSPHFEPSSAEPGNAKNETEWEELFADEQLPSSFTDRFMKALDGIEIEPADEDLHTHAQIASALSNAAGSPNQSSAPIEHQIRRKPKSNRRKIWISSAVVLLLAGAALFYSQPTIAERVRSLFSSNSIIDTGMREARDAGFLTGSEAVSTDSGYTIKAEEVIADSTRLIVGFSVFDKKGNPVPGQLGSMTEFRIYDSLGEINYSGILGGNSSIDQHVFVFNRAAVGEVLTLVVWAHEIQLSPGEVLSDWNREIVPGNWGLSIESDLTQAAKASLTTRLDQSYETPAGLKIDMLGAIRTPSGGALEFETSLSPAARQKAVDGAQAEHKVLYRIEKENGESLTDNFGPYNNPSPVFDRWNQSFRWFYPFYNFPFNTEPLRFVMEGYVIREKSEASVTFDPSALSPEEPAKFTDSGDDFTLTGVTIAPNPNWDSSANVSIPSAGIITFGGKYHNPDFPNDDWIALDDTGREYPVVFSGGYAFENPKLDGSQTFVVEGLEAMPSSLTLKRTAVAHLYRDADWSFILPQSGTPGVVPE